MTDRTLADFWIAYRRISLRIAELQRQARYAKTPTERAAAEKLLDVLIARWRLPPPCVPLKRRGIRHA